MKIIDIKRLPIFDVCAVKFERIKDERGFFSETFRKSDFKNADLPVRLQFGEFLQTNEVFSKAKTFRGMHVNHIAPQGKFVRCVYGRLIDFVLDVNPDSPTYKKLIAYELKADPDADFSEWIWIPQGLAHGTLLTEDSVVEYFCTSEWQAEGERSYSILSDDVDWSLCDKKLAKEAKELFWNPELKISEKDRAAGDIELKEEEKTPEEELDDYFREYQKNNQFIS